MLMLYDLMLCNLQTNLIEMCICAVPWKLAVMELGRVGGGGIYLLLLSSSFRIVVSKKILGYEDKIAFLYI